jgi:ribosomal protein L36
VICSPTTVIRRIGTMRIRKSIKSVHRSSRWIPSRRARTYVLNEITETFWKLLPTITDSDPDCSIQPVVSGCWIATPRDHGIPDLVKRMFRGNVHARIYRFTGNTQFPTVAAIPMFLIASWGGKVMWAWQQLIGERICAATLKACSPRRAGERW